jgi:OOP family OmpA-OmpF porin
MKSKLIIKAFVPVIALASLVGCATQTAVTPVITTVDLNPKIASGQLAQKVDAFEVIFDATTSMNEIYKKGTKLNQEKSLITLFNDTIPNLKLTAAARAFGQFSRFGDATSKSLFAPMAYTQSSLPQAIEPFESGLGFSPLDAAIDGATSDLQSQGGQLAVIAFSDGEDMEKYTPVEAAERMKNIYGDRVCIYTVHLGDNENGMKVMQQVADAGQCGFMVTGETISTPEGMADFVEQVFLKTSVAEKPREAAITDSDGDGVADNLDRCPGTPAGVKVDQNGCPLDSDGDGVYDYLDRCPGTPAGVKVDQNGCPLDSDSDGVYDYLDKCPETPVGVKVDQDGCPYPVAVQPAAPQPAAPQQAAPPVAPSPAASATETAIVEKGRVTLNVKFDFDKSDIRKEFHQEIGNLAAVMKKYPDLKILLEGHTDSIGGAQYNQKLSERRANAVKKYLVEKFGIEASRLTTKGYGLTRPVASNATKEGRQKNRRVDAAAEYIKQ